MATKAGIDAPKSGVRSGALEGASNFYIDAQESRRSTGGGAANPVRALELAAKDAPGSSWSGENALGAPNARCRGRLKRASRDGRGLGRSRRADWSELLLRFSRAAGWSGVALESRS